MNKLNKNQKLTVRRFMDVADTNDEVGAIQALKDASWNMDAAFEYYFYSARSRSSKKSTTNATGITAMFDSYKVQDNQEEERIEAEGIIRFLENLGVDPMDPVTLVLSMKMDAETMGKYTKEEFNRGMMMMECDSMDKLKEKIGALRKELTRPSSFKDVYEFTFGFAKEPNTKALALETAVGLWKVLMTDKWCFTDEWCDFLERSHGKAISNDTWSQVLQFSTQVGENLQSYDPNDAWPYLIDEFVEAKLEEKK
ncbi:putative leucine zipper protein [Ostreococcus tauri]|uniref:Defective in cullin neddylation protein n=1 Tax=Ostreococcus tauri TaxID=70448 RepID=A0A1Y5I9G8_OSTTA|nr:putative leucine zipper protein [Ostreococcus tauri]